jgi:hypothetical protein
MDIGPEGKPFIAEPLEDPFRKDEPATEPHHEPAPQQVPAPQPA